MLDGYEATFEKILADTSPAVCSAVSGQTLPAPDG
jgi:hypothetical protein